MNIEVDSLEVQSALQQMCGLTLLKSRNFCATRHFYFGRRPIGPAEARYTLGIECAWRIEEAGKTVVGSDDYLEPDENQTDPNWEPGMPGGHLQDQRLVQLLGQLVEGDVVNTGAGFNVESVEVSGAGDLRIDFNDLRTLRVFVMGTRSMQWIVMPPFGHSLLLSDGVIQRSTRSRGNPAPEAGS